MKLCSKNPNGNKMTAKMLKGCLPDFFYDQRLIKHDNRMFWQGKSENLQKEDHQLNIIELVISSFNQQIPKFK